MALDATKPTNTDNLATHAAYIRAIAAEVNSLAAGVSDVDQTNLSISAGTTALVVGTDLSSAMIEIVNVSAGAAVDIANITGGTAGQIKLFIAEDNNVSFSNDAVSIIGGVLRLNQIPATLDFDLSLGDILAICNIGGTNGYWKELFRTLFVG